MLVSPIITAARTKANLQKVSYHMQEEIESTQSCISQSQLVEVTNQES